MMKSVAFATRRLGILLNRFGWLMAILWVAILAYERNTIDSAKLTSASFTSCTCPDRQ